MYKQIILKAVKKSYEIRKYFVVNNKISLNDYWLKEGKE